MMNIYEESTINIWICRVFEGFGTVGHRRLRLIIREAICEKRNLYQTRLYKYNLFKNFKYSL